MNKACLKNLSCFGKNGIHENLFTKKILSLFSLILRAHIKLTSISYSDFEWISDFEDISLDWLIRLKSGKAFYNHWIFM